MLNKVLLLLILLLICGCATIPDDIDYKDRGDLKVELNLTEYGFNNYSKFINQLKIKANNSGLKKIDILSTDSNSTTIQCFSTFNYQASLKLPSGGKAKYPMRYNLIITNNNGEVNFLIKDYVIWNSIKTLIINKQISEAQLIREFQSEIIELII